MKKHRYEVNDNTASMYNWVCLDCGGYFRKRERGVICTPKSKPYRCPGCGCFESVVTVDEKLGVDHTESTPLRYCEKCRKSFLASLHPTAGLTPATSNAVGPF